MPISIAMTDDLASAAAHAGRLVLVLACGALRPRLAPPWARFCLRIFCAAWTVLFMSSMGGTEIGFVW